MIYNTNAPTSVLRACWLPSIEMARPPRGLEWHCRWFYHRVVSVLPLPPPPPVAGCRFLDVPTTHPLYTSSCISRWGRAIGREDCHQKHSFIMATRYGRQTGKMNTKTALTYAQESL